MRSETTKGSGAPGNCAGRTAELYHQITDPLLPQAQSVFDDTATLDAAVDVLDAAATMIENLVSPLLLEREGLATGFSRRHEDLHLGHSERQNA